MFGGIWGWRHIWSRRDHQPLFYVALGLMLGIWIQLWYDRTICPRYALPIVLMAAPWASLGLGGLLARAVRLMTWLGWSPKLQHALAAGILLAIAVAGVADALTSNTEYYEVRHTAGALGRKIHDKYATPPVIVGPLGITPIVSYYAGNCPYHAFRWEADDKTVLAFADDSRTDIVLLHQVKQFTSARCAALAAQLKHLAFQPAPIEWLPENNREVLVFVRRR